MSPRSKCACVLVLAFVATCCDNKSHCPEGQSLCWAQCVNLMKDYDNCGECDNQCDPHSDCIDGLCKCNPGFTKCDGLCVDLDFNTDNCGECGNVCDAGASCCDGTCGSCDCPQGFIVCGNQCIDPNIDESHCGACFNACGENQECMDGQCVDICVCHEDADCMHGYCCNSCMCFPKGCEGKCCGVDACGGTCPDECADGEICDDSTCACEEYGDENDPCPYGEINPDEPECGPGRICLPFANGECPSGTNDECRDNWGNPFCIGGFCRYSMCFIECDPDFDEFPCGCPHDYFMNEIVHEQEQICICIYGPPEGTQRPGEPCPFGDVNTSYDFCGGYGECNGMVCLGNDSTDGTCPGGSAAECTEIPESYNPVCVNGTCGFSFCAPPCINGACDDGFKPEDVGGTCYCTPLP